MANGPIGTLVPTRKVGGGLAGGLPVGVVVVWLLQMYVLPADKPIPADVAATIGSICSFLVGYFIPSAKD